MDCTLLAAGTENYVRELFTTLTEKEYPYHNLKHTTLVVLHAREIARHYALSEEDTSILTIAAWFHDVGHLFGDMHDHEESGVSIMKNYLATVHTQPEIVSAVASCILATRPGAEPKGQLEMILCDADTYHFGTDYFKKTDPAMHRELEQRTGKSFPDWLAKSLQLLKNHHFFTDYCQQKLEEGKQKNIAWLQSQLS